MVEEGERSEPRGRRIRRRRCAATAAVALLVGLAACGGDARDGAPDDAAAPAAAASPSGGQPHTHEEGAEHAHEGTGSHTHAAADTLDAAVALEPGSDVGWRGSATLLAVGDSVRVLVSVEGAPGGSRHPVELTAGSCDDPGPELASLTPVAAGSSGRGSSQTTLPGARLEGHGHGALRMSAADGSHAACAPVHLSLQDHTHG